jgi:hypothetical protein
LRHQILAPVEQRFALTDTAGERIVEVYRRRERGIRRQRGRLPIGAADLSATGDVGYKGPYTDYGVEGFPISNYPLAVA